MVLESNPSQLESLLYYLLPITKEKFLELDLSVIGVKIHALHIAKAGSKLSTSRSDSWA